MLTRLKQLPFWRHPELRPYRDWPWGRIALGLLALIAFNALAVPLVRAHSDVRTVTLHVDRCVLEGGKRGRVCQLSWTDHGHHQRQVRDNELTPGSTIPGWVTPAGVATNPVEVVGYQLGLLALLNVCAITAMWVLGWLAEMAWNRVRGSGVGS